MKHKFQTKLRSRTGASISFGLLIFLVCTVLCSVILVSATTAAGRMSKIAETDQRYYAVTSAAELLKDLIDGETVTIEKVTTGERTEVYVNGELVPGKYDEDGKLVEGTSGTVYDGETTLSVIGSSTTVVDGSPSFPSIPEVAAYMYYTIDANNANRENPPLTSLPINYTLESSDDLKEKEKALEETDSLKVSIAGSVAENGDINLTVGTVGAANVYQINLVFSASVNGPTESETAGESETIVKTEAEYDLKTPVTKTKTTILTWTLTGIKANPEEPDT